MNELVVDTSVLIMWFRRAGDAHLPAARALRQRFLAGELLPVVPPLLFLEVLKAASRR